MRNFDERMEEIRNRSKARIAKRRKIVGSVVLPLVFCLAASSFLLTPQNQVTPTVATNPVSTGVQMYAYILVETDDGELTLSDPVAVDSFQQLLLKLSEDSGYNVESQSSNREYVATGAHVPNGGASLVSITVNEQGSSHRYTYEAARGILIDKKTDAVFYLNSAEQLHLHELLNLFEN